MININPGKASWTIILEGWAIWVAMLATLQVSCQNKGIGLRTCAKSERRLEGLDAYLKTSDPPRLTVFWVEGFGGFVGGI